MSFQLQEGEIGRITYAGHEYVYKVEQYKVLKDYWSLTVAGGPYRYIAITTCRRALLKKNLKEIIESLRRK